MKKIARPAPHELLHMPLALMDQRETSSVCTISKTQIYTGMAAGTFPQAIRLGKRSTRWRAPDILAWLQAQSGSAK